MSDEPFKLTPEQIERFRQTGIRLDREGRRAQAPSWREAELGEDVVDAPDAVALPCGDLVDDAVGLEPVEGGVHARQGRARESLRAELGNLIMEGTERVLRREVDSKAHNDLVEELVAQI